MWPVFECCSYSSHREMLTLSNLGGRRVDLFASLSPIFTPLVQAQLVRPAAFPGAQNKSHNIVNPFIMLDDGKYGWTSITKNIKALSVGV